MKKLMALLMAAIMLLPVTALADATTYRYTVTIDPDYYEQMLTAELQSELGSAADMSDAISTVTDLICGIMNASTLTVTTQDDGVHLSWEMQDSTVAEALITWTDDSLLLSTSLLPDTVLELPLSDMIAAVNGVDWNGIADAARQEWDAWYMSRELTLDVAGSYAGAAYEGANERIIIRFDDADVALLVDGFLMILEDNESLYSLFDRDALQQAIHDMRRFNHEAAMNNAYSYELVIAYDSDFISDEFVGMSLNVREGDREAWSVSLGMEDENVRLIAGFNVDGNTNYFVLTQQIEERDGDRVTTTVAAVYQVKEGVSYAEASADLTNAIYHAEIVDVSRTVGTGTHYRTVVQQDAVYTVNGEEVSRAHIEATEDFTAEPYSHIINQTVSIDGKENVATYQTVGRKSEPHKHPEGAKHVTLPELLVVPSVQAEMSEKLDEGVTAFALMLFKNVPTEVLMELMRIMQ